MISECEVEIDDDGTLSYIFNDDLAEMFGADQTVRASHVEPCGQGWTADMSPVGGPVLGPFSRRSEALAAEVEYIRTMGISEAAKAAMA